MKSYTPDLIAVACIILGLLPWVLGDGVPFTPSDPPPIEVKGLHGLVIEETDPEDSDGRTPDFATVINSKAVEDSREGFADWKMYDQGEMDEKWQAVYDEVSKSEGFTLPYLVIINGSKWKHGPVPLVKSGDGLDVDASIEKVTSAIEEMK